MPETQGLLIRDHPVFREGDFCLLVDPRGRRHLLQLKSGRHFHHPRYGRLDHTTIIGNPVGVRIRGTHLNDVICLRPTLEEFIMKRLKRQTQIIYPKDLGPLLLAGDIFPSARVLESGIGSGAAAVVLLRYLGFEGRLVSYERREEFAQVALQTIGEAAATFGGHLATHRVEIRDVYEGIEERELDTILLDVPEPHRAVESAALALRPGGTLICWLPTVLQVYGLVRTLQKSECWAEIRTSETLVRPWDVSEDSIRPTQRMVAHTGFMIRARRVVRRVASESEQREASGSRNRGDSDEEPE